MPLKLRPACEFDLPSMAKVGVAAFENDPINTALFPAHLRSLSRSALNDRLDFRVAKTTERMRTVGVHSVVVIDDSLHRDDEIIGYVQWEAPKKVKLRAEEQALEKQLGGTRKNATYPPTFDETAYVELYSRIDAEAFRIFGDAGTHAAWCKQLPGRHWLHAF